MISFENAQVFFSASSHHKAAIWAAFGSTHRQGAIATARRMLSRALGRAMRDDEAAYVEGARTRDEYAVYEQALWLLEHGQVADATGSDPVPVLTGQVDLTGKTGSDDNSFTVLSPEAMRWFGWTGAAVIRG